MSKFEMVADINQMAEYLINLATLSKNFGIYTTGHDIKSLTLADTLSDVTNIFTFIRVIMCHT